MRFVTRLLALAFGCLAAIPAAAQQITGAGATFPYPIYSKWAEVYGKQTGLKLYYQPVGLGGGIAQIKAGTVVFGASDAPLSAQQLQDAGLAQFPMVIGGVVPVVNVKGVKTGQLRFTGPLLAEIYLGKIKRWNDPALVSVNPDVTLPDQAITVVHRSVASGTTFNWVDYLCKVSPEWKAKVGEGTSVSWPAGVGRNGNEGVANYVSHTSGAVGYVEYSYALQHNVTLGLIQNKAGHFVNPDIASFQAAAASAEWSQTKDFSLTLTDAPGSQSYPVTAASFILMYKQPKDPAGSKAALAFFKWALEHGQEEAKQLNYVPLPDTLVKEIEAYWQAQIH